MHGYVVTGKRAEPSRGALCWLTDSPAWDCSQPAGKGHCFTSKYRAGKAQVFPASSVCTEYRGAELSSIFEDIHGKERRLSFPMSARSRTEFGRYPESEQDC